MLTYCSIWETDFQYARRAVYRYYNGHDHRINARHRVGCAEQVLRLESQEERRLHIHQLSPAGIGFTLLIVLGLFVLHGLEIWTFAIAFVGLEAVPDLRTAVYFSTITYGAIGYDDDPMATE